MSVTLNIDSTSVPASRGETLFECAEKAGVHVPTSCFKQGKCRECLVEVLSGMECLSAHTPEELHLQGAYRLSCRARIESAGDIRCVMLKREALRVEDSGALHPSAGGSLDSAIRRNGRQILLDGNVIAEASGPLHGLAVDIGTTTVVMRLLDLETGQIVATQSFENPQRFGGSDVMARIRYDSENKGRLLQRTLLGYMSHAIEAFPCNPQTIYEMVVAGNATMRDLFFGLPVHSIGQRPYRSITEHDVLEGHRTSTALAIEAKLLRLPTHPKARVYGMPLVSGHVGADAAACLLAIDMAREDRTVALMDIGTNTELLVGNRHRIFAASCPAGPAFEGGGVTCGAAAFAGAIEHVHIGDDGTPFIETIGGKSPTGICGSGLIDILSELLRTGCMNSLGRFEQSGSPFELDRKRGVILTENDVSQLAQAKGANLAGVHITLAQYGIDFDQLDVFYLAGGFAKHIDLNAARRIGLIPNLPDEKIQRIGNASIEGAAIALQSVARRRKLEAMVQNVTHVELETDPRFFDYFVEACQYRPVKTNVLQS